MVIKTTWKWVGLAGLLALAACAPTGPASECVMNPDQNQTACTVTQEPIDLK